MNIELTWIHKYMFTDSCKWIICCYQYYCKGTIMATFWHVQVPTQTPRDQLRNCDMVNGEHDNFVWSLLQNTHVAETRPFIHQRHNVIEPVGHCDSHSFLLSGSGMCFIHFSAYTPNSTTTTQFPLAMNFTVNIGIGIWANKTFH